MRRAAFTCLMLLGGCGGGGAADNKTDHPVFTVTMDSEDAEGGVRPRLTIGCGEVGRSLMLHLVTRPDPAPSGPAAGLVKIDDGAPERVALQWVQDDVWVPRLDDAAKGGLIRRMLTARSIYFAGPMALHVYRWDTERLGDSLAPLRQACA